MKELEAYSQALAQGTDTARVRIAELEADRKAIESLNEGALREAGPTAKVTK